MLDVSPTKFVGRELGLIALDNFETGAISARKEVALLVADAAVALMDRLDLGDFSFVNKRAAVAVAAIGLKGVDHVIDS